MWNSTLNLLKWINFPVAGCKDVNFLNTQCSLHNEKKQHKNTTKKYEHNYYVHILVQFEDMRVLEISVALAFIIHFLS